MCRTYTTGKVTHGTTGTKVKARGADEHDLLSNWLVIVIGYCAPIAAILVSGATGVDQAWRTVIWVVALVAMGTVCVANAVRCGRIHCYFTGPFFIVMAILTVLYGVGALSLGNHGWSVISLLLFGGTVALYYLPELLLGRYRRGTEQPRS